MMPTVSVLELNAAHALLDLRTAVNLSYNEPAAPSPPLRAETTKTRELDSNTISIFLGHPKGLKAPLSRVQGGPLYYKRRPLQCDFAEAGSSKTAQSFKATTPSPVASPTENMNSSMEIAIQTDFEVEHQLHEKDATIIALHAKIKELEDQLKDLSVVEEDAVELPLERENTTNETNYADENNGSILDTTNDDRPNERSALSPIDENNVDLVPIGDGYAKVPKRLLRTLNWDSHTSTTRKLLTALFPRGVLATHSMTGKQSPAFPNKPAKKRLDPNIVNDIVLLVSQKCKVEAAQVRNSITIKLADESKMYRTRMHKRLSE